MSAGIASVKGACAITAAMRGSPAATGKDVAAAERRAPHSDPVGVDTVEPASPGDDGTVVVVLTGDVEQLARLAGRSAEVPVVVHDDGQAGVAERLGVGGQPLVAGGGEPVGHDDQGTVLRALPPARHR